MLDYIQSNRVLSRDVTSFTLGKLYPNLKNDKENRAFKIPVFSSYSDVFFNFSSEQVEFKKTDKNSSKWF